MLVAIKNGDFIENVLRTNLEHSDVELDDVEISYFKKYLNVAIESGNAWTYNQSLVFIKPDSTAILYCEFFDKKDTLKIMSEILVKYPGLRLTPLNEYYYGLISLISMPSIMKYKRGEVHLVDFKITDEEANALWEYLQ